MLSKIIHFSIYNKLIVGLLTIGLVIWGIYSATRLPIDAVTDITDNQVMIITTTPTLAAQEVERLVTFPVEQTMASIPGIDDMRSFSRFGLSLVTVVFKEGVDPYWARQQVQERLTIAEKEIPAGVGKPEMAPVTTGLGEIYQYVIHPKPGYEDKYDATELRTIQDWIIKRQLLGTPGVAEVSGFGGYVKQYEIAVSPDKLQSAGVSIPEIFDALEHNNQNTGGAYIDKNPYAYFIRSEGLVKSLDELKDIVVKKTADGTPILIGDVADVKFGHSVRYGAATRNGEGEVVTGIVMMLKGANSSEVITNVKEKIEQIKKSLPEGVTIEPFLDRKKLVDSAIQTVAKNLTEGALIVVFVLILFLGSWRSGLIVASVIPLALLFAFGMMNLFGVSGNLMSLGAIDFGLIVDGTVIIVEASMHHITRGGFKERGIERLTAAQMDREVYLSSSRIRTAASFGEIIILIVYLPILTLTGVEGKMFRPMAETVSFAILGAFLLSLTYVPMMTALGLSRRTSHRRNISDRMMERLQALYARIIDKVLRHKVTVVGSAFALFVVALVLFDRLGGEFIPQLDEGDFAVETRVPVGSSMQQMIEVSQKAQKILLQYPEVEEVVNKIGSGEIPTDPMPIEAGDMMVILKPRAEWTTADSREGLIERMQASLSVIPNATFSFQQPIQMRFNELLTGAKQDVVIKIYGEDLDLLADLARNVGRKIKDVDGVEDLYVEEVTGLPQIHIGYNRAQIARYGLNVSDVNDVVQTAFAGKSAGLVFEGERRFELVVRLADAYRRDITDVQNICVPTPTGKQVPLNELATIEYKPGPVQIQRDNAKRRITIGFNVRSHDVQSIVTDIKRIVDEKVKMPPGYYMTYGGQFKNLERAIQRLSIAVPTALLLILLLLYFTFKSVKQSLLIFTAIPLSAIGGVFALLLRGMPFSISAGVGFIALFGVAVLNGIVLIAEFNHLLKEGVTDVYERVRQGTQTRLRPVLMTATVASLGFLPMALSTSSGAEVQRPLATVVIGGLITATALTLVVLPILYIYFTKNLHKPHLHIGKGAAVTLPLLALLCCLPLEASAQTASAERTLTLQQAIEEALQNNGGIRAAELDVQVQQRLERSGIAIPKTEIAYKVGKLNEPTVNDNGLSITQRIDFPTLYARQRQLGKERTELSRTQKAVRENELVRDVKRAYYKAVYHIRLQILLAEQDSLYAGLQKASEKRYATGESTRLESVTSTTQAMQVRNRMRQNRSDMEIALRELQVLLDTTDSIAVEESELAPAVLDLPSDTSAVLANPLLRSMEQNVEVVRRETQVERNRWLPDIVLGFDNQTFGGSSKRYSAFSVGLAIPLFPGGNRAKVQASKMSEQAAWTTADYARTQVRGRLQQCLQECRKLAGTVEYYRTQAVPQAELIVENSNESFRNGEISYTQHVMNLSLANDIATGYLESIYQYNLAVVEVETLSGNSK